MQAQNFLLHFSLSSTWPITCHLWNFPKQNQLVSRKETIIPSLQKDIQQTQTHCKLYHGMYTLQNFAFPPIHWWYFLSVYLSLLAVPHLETLLDICIQSSLCLSKQAFSYTCLKQNNCPPCCPRVDRDVRYSRTPRRKTLLSSQHSMAGSETDTPRRSTDSSKELVTAPHSALVCDTQECHCPHLKHLHLFTILKARLFANIHFSL